MSLKTRVRRLEAISTKSDVAYIPVALKWSEDRVEVAGETMTQLEYEARYRERINAAIAAGTGQEVFGINFENVNEPDAWHTD